MPGRELQTLAAPPALALVLAIALSVARAEEFDTERPAVQQVRGEQRVRMTLEPVSSLDKGWRLRADAADDDSVQQIDDRKDLHRHAGPHLRVPC